MRQDLNRGIRKETGLRYDAWSVTRLEHELETGTGLREMERM